MERVIYSRAKISPACVTITLEVVARARSGGAERGREGTRRTRRVARQVKFITRRVVINSAYLADSAANTSLIKSRKLYYNGELINRKIVLYLIEAGV